MEILKLYLKLSKSFEKLGGFTLIELLVAVLMGSIVMIGLGSGLVALMSTTNKSMLKGDLKNQLNRALDYINEDIKRSRFAGLRTSKTTNDTLLLTYFENANDTVSYTIEYYMDQVSSTEPWLGPNVIRRRLNGGQWQVLVDGISDNNAITPTSKTNGTFPACTGLSTVPSGNAGFRACININNSSQNVKLYRVGIALLGEVSDNETLGVQTKTIARSISRALLPPVLSVSDSDPTPEPVSWTSVGGATGYEIYRCIAAAGNSSCNPQIGATITISGTSYPSLFYFGAANNSTETLNPATGDRWCYAGRSTDGVNYSELSTPPKCAAISTGGTPSAVTNLVADSTVNPTKPKVTWNQANDATNYYLYRCSTTSTTCTPNSSGTAVYGPSTVREFTETSDPPAGSKWCYLAKATNAIGSSADSNVDCGLLNSSATPNAPTISVSSSNSNIINWSDTTSSGATTYELYQCEASSTTTCTPNVLFPGFPKFVNTATQATSATVGKRWCYGVKAINTIPNPTKASSLGINNASGQPACGDIALAAPSFTNAPFTGVSPTVQWSTVTSATSYELYRCTTKDLTAPCAPTSGTKVTAAGYASTSYTESSSPGDNERFCYGVLAKNTGGSSAMSAASCGAKKVALCIVPSVMGSPTTCTAQTDAIIKQFTDGGFTNVGTPTNVNIGTGKVVWGLTPTSGSAVDCGTLISISWYTTGGTTCAATPPTAPTLLSVSGASQSNSTVSIAWSTVFGATSYDVYGCTTNNGTCAPAGIIASNVGAVNYTNSPVDLSGSKNACYKIIAKGTAGNSPDSNVKCAK